MSKMKLAEALIERKSLKGQIDQVVSRMKENTLIEEGGTPDEDIAELEKTYESLALRFLDLANRINNTNNHAMLDNKMTIAKAIIERDYLKSKITSYRAVKDSASNSARRGWQTTKYIRLIDMASYQKMIDDLSRQFRELDTKIQGQNWNTELL